jgi:hypothetical protein
LPYLEQNALYTAALDEGLAVLNGKAVKVFVSPTDPSATQPGGWASYAVNGNAVARRGLSLGRSFRDGTSTTILFTERYMACGQSPVYNAWAVNVDGTALNGTSSTVAAVLTTDSQPQYGPGVAACVPGSASTADSSAILTAMADGSVRSTSRSQAQGATASPGPPVTNWQAALTLQRGEILGADR